MQNNLRHKIFRKPSLSLLQFLQIRYYQAVKLDIPSQDTNYVSGKEEKKEVKRERKKKDIFYINTPT